jgi:hypothetical protein
MDIMDRMDVMDLTFDGRMDRHKKYHLLYVSIPVPVHCPLSIVHSAVHSCLFRPSCPFLSLSIVHKKSFPKKKILGDSSTKF